MYMLTPFCIKTTFARIDFLRQGARLVSGEGTHNVKFLAENQTKQVCSIHVYGQRNGAHVRLRPSARAA